MQMTIGVIAVIMCACALSVAAQEKKVDRSSLPPAVEKTVQSASRGTTVKGFATEREKGKRVYEAQLLVDGHTRDVQIAMDGSVNEVEEEVAFGSLPAGVKRSLTTRAGAAKIVKVESLTKHDKLVAYEAATLAGAKRGEVQVGLGGEKLDHEE